MSEQAAEPVDQAQEPEGIELPNDGTAAFGALMDALVSVEAEPEGGADGAAAEAAEGGAGQGAAASEGAGDQAGAEAAAAGGAAGEPGASDAGTGDAGAAADSGSSDAAAGAAGGSSSSDRPNTWTAESSELIPKLGELSTALEDRVSKAYHSEALEAVREEHGKYFEALESHPRLLVGKTVPRIGGEGEETLRDTADAREWQEAVKSILVEEVKDRAGRALEENKEFLNTVHASIELFQNNADLVPGTKDFDVELANKFAALAKPYELRVEGKLQGYSIPVQPIINQLRTDLAAARAKTDAAPTAKVTAKTDAGKQQAAAGAAAQQNAAATTEDQPQAGLQSKAGSSSDSEDYSTLFGTLGLPNLRI